MQKGDHVRYWQSLAEEDVATAQYNIEGGRHVPALFFLHLATEKLLKAHWVKDNVSNTPPFSHDLQKIAADSSLTLSAEQYDYLSIINTWNIEARYPDYKRTLYRIADGVYMQQHFTAVSDLFQWLQSAL